MKAELRIDAQEAACKFLTEDAEYRMGEIEAEQPNPLTRRLSQTLAESVEDGVRMLLSVDESMASRAANVLAGEEYADFADAVRQTLAGGGRVIFSGCGSSGRLSMRLEQSWRTAVDALAAAYPAAAEKLLARRDAVGSIMTGGEYAVIRAVESFEDSAAVGREQAKEWLLGAGDLLVGVTATGETTSILGTAMQALEDGAAVYMLICADPEPLMKRMARVREVYSHPRCRSITLPCGAFALTGSSRMQSSTFEQLCGAAALECALQDLLASCPIAGNLPEYGDFGRLFVDTVAQLLRPEAVAKIADAVVTEQAVYERGGLMTLWADEYLLDVLTDTTERAPTFSTPPFQPSGSTEGERSWAFVKNPACDTPEAWVRCFAREPRCIEWTAETYAALGFSPERIAHLPRIDAQALGAFSIGNEPQSDREGKNSHAMWVGADAAPACFAHHAARYDAASEFTLVSAGLVLPATNMAIYEHLALKLMLNTLSTAVMARMGRVHGNWMTCLAMSNKKLIDRSARIVSDLCGVSYEAALEAVYFEQLSAEAEGRSCSPAREAIRRLGMRA